MMRVLKQLLLAVIANFILVPGMLHATDDDWRLPVTEEELTREEQFFRLEDDVLTFTTLAGQRPERAPSIVYVLTAREIRELGVRTLYDVLRVVPGFDILTSTTGQPRIAVRGVLSSLSNNVLILQDGYRLNDIHTGSPTALQFELPVDNIQRIEIIRGPGSTLFGNNALAGVINIITKDPETLQGFNVSAGGGSFETHHYSLTFGQLIRDVAVSGFVQYVESQGPHLLIAEDAQSIHDRESAIWGIAPASHAPADTEQPYQGIDANITFFSGGLTLRGKFKQEYAGHVVGPVMALTDSEEQTRYYALSLEYTSPFWDAGQFSAKLHLMQTWSSPEYQLSPPGFANDRFELFPDGVLWKPEMASRRVEAEFTADYRLFDAHRVVVGASFDREQIVDAALEANVDPHTYAPFGTLQSLTSSLDSIHRNHQALFLQDTWTMTNAVNMVGGVRYDDYDEFGQTLSPRGGLVWGISEDLYLKCLYGKAFRVPSLYEVYGMGLSDGMLNSDLESETIETLETAVDYMFRDNIWFGVNGFYNRLHNLITATSTDSILPTLNNADDVNIWGLETWLKAGFKTERGENNHLFLNYTYQSPREETLQLVDLSQHLANVGLNVAISRYVNLNTAVIIRGKRARTAGDSRTELPAYARVNAAVIVKNLWDALEVSCSVQNVFDEKIVEPAPLVLPGDFPTPGRHVFVKATYRF